MLDGYFLRGAVDIGVGECLSCAHGSGSRSPREIFSSNFLSIFSMYLSQLCPSSSKWVPAIKLGVN